MLTPPLFIDLAKRLRGNYPTGKYGCGLSGDYRSWAEAMGTGAGYASEHILERTRAALMKVKTGEATYEKDAVLYDEIQYSWPLLAGLLWVAARHGGVLNVMDFGGSLGSTYFQNRLFLSVLPKVRWNIIEQPRHVEVGNAWFRDDYLYFYESITDCLAATQPNVVILSGVLQYLEHPYTILDQILGLPCDLIIIDRTPFLTGPKDRLCVQTAPPLFYTCTTRYPSWIFSRERFYTYLNNEDWQVMVTFDTPDRLVGPVDVVYQGLILVRSKHLSSD
jgi:putative methyltransferase (TIGR04325 family)